MKVRTFSTVLSSGIGLDCPHLTQPWCVWSRRAAWAGSQCGSWVVQIPLPSHSSLSMWLIVIQISHHCLGRRGVCRQLHHMLSLPMLYLVRGWVDLSSGVRSDVFCLWHWSLKRVKALQFTSLEDQWGELEETGKGKWLFSTKLAIPLVVQKASDDGGGFLLAFLIFI